MFTAIEKYFYAYYRASNNFAKVTGVLFHAADFLELQVGYIFISVCVRNYHASAIKRAQFDIFGRRHHQPHEFLGEILRILKIAHLELVQAPALEHVQSDFAAFLPS
jgi:hypothetical protein